MNCRKCNKELTEKHRKQWKADMVYTDPPYGIDLDTDYSNKSQGKLADGRVRYGRDYRKVHCDNEDYDPNPLLEIFKDVDEIFLWGANNYAHVLPNGRNHGWLVWDKKQTDSGLDSRAGDFELCWSKKIHKFSIIRCIWSGPFGHIKKDDGDHRVHPTQKPVRLAVEIMSRWGKDKTNIVDLYGGSGSTLIACEKTGKHCFMSEIDEHYCSVIIERWQKFTGLKAQKAV